MSNTQESGQTKKIQIRPIALMLIGLPGTGKTSYRRHINAVPITSDDYIEIYAKNHNATYDEVFSEAVGSAEDLMYNDLKAAVVNEYPIIWDQTNLTRKGRAKKLKMIPEVYKKIAVYFLPPKEEQMWRNRLNFRQGKTIPERTLFWMQSHVDFPSYNEGFEEIIVVDEDGKVIKDWQ